MPICAQVATASALLADAYGAVHRHRWSRAWAPVVQASAVLAHWLVLAMHRPFVRYWADPRDRRRQAVVIVVPRSRWHEPWTGALGVLAVASGTAYTVGLLLLMTVPADLLVPTAVHAVVAWTVTLLAVTIDAVVERLPRPGRIARAGRRGPAPDIVVSHVASTTAGGLLAVRAHLRTRHPGARVAARARDAASLELFGRLGLHPVTPGAGWTTGTV